jgi:chloramphenicol 3-O-phosphotransferase
MSGSTAHRQIVILNGTPRSGKSSIVAAIQERLDGVWMNVGIDVARAMTPPRAQPGIGLRPGEAGIRRRRWCLCCTERCMNRLPRTAGSD